MDNAKSQTAIGAAMQHDDNEPETTAHRLAATLNDRLTNSTHEQLALETAALRAFMFATLDSIEHAHEHLRHGQIHNAEEMSVVLTALERTLTHRLANLEDVRIEMQRRHNNKQRD